MKLKKIFSLFCFCLALFGLSCISFAATTITPNSPAMTIVWVSPRAVSDVTQTETDLNKGLQEGLANYQFSFKDIVDSQTLMQEYMIENSLVPDDIEGSVGFLPKKADMKAMATQANVKFVAFINTRITDAKLKESWFSSKHEVTTLFTVMIYSLDADKIVYLRQLSVKDNASNSDERAFEKSYKTFIREHLAPNSIILKED